MLPSKKLIRITTVPMALAYPLNGQPSYMHRNGLDVILISSDGKELQKVLDRETCKHMVVHMTRRITPFRDMVAVLKLIRIFKKERPDIVHTETPKAGLVGMIAAWICKVPIRIHTVAGLPLMVAKGFKLKVLQWVEKITYAAATNVWPNSESLKQYILHHKFTAEDKLHVVGKGSSNGIEVERFSSQNLDQLVLDEIKRSFDYDQANTYLLFVGRLVRDKGIVELVHVFTRLQKNDPALKLILVGQYEPNLDPLPADIEEEIKSNPAIVHVSWTGKVEYYMALADYFVFPSYREGFPNVLLEAAAMNLPIICSRIAGNVDIVTCNATGWIFESQDAQSLEDVLVKALQSKARSAEMAASLHHVITNAYARESFWRSMLDAYRNLLH